MAFCALAISLVAVGRMRQSETTAVHNAWAHSDAHFVLVCMMSVRVCVYVYVYASARLLCAVLVVVAVTFVIAVVAVAATAAVRCLD